MIARLFIERARFVNIANLFLKDREAAEDMVSDSIMYILEHKEEGNFKDIDSLRNYLLMTVRHRCLNELKSRSLKEEKFRGLTMADIEELEDEDMYDSILVREMRSLVAGSNKKMSRLSFDIFVLNRINGMTYRQIAEKYGISTGKVIREMNKALAVMKLIFRDYLAPVISGLILILPALAG